MLAGQGSVQGQGPALRRKRGSKRETDGRLMVATFHIYGVQNMPKYEVEPERSHRALCGVGGSRF